MPETTLACIKGTLREYGSRLQHAPAGLTYIGRRCTMGGWRLEQSPWANPYSIRQAGSAEAAVDLYASWLAMHPELVERARRELAGGILGCWCPVEKGAPCHGRPLVDAIERRGIWAPGGACDALYDNARAALL